jgi:TetR/AcrR family transcriptional repressor of nem operon
VMSGPEGPPAIPLVGFLLDWAVHNCYLPAMAIGRPTEFDRQTALEKSMDLFWRNGYEATSLAALLEEMGIGRQSLYNTFGDKHSLFVEAVRHYIASTGGQLIAQLQASGSPVGNIQLALEQVVEFIGAGECRGCLVTNSIVELAPHDDEVRRIVEAMISRVEKTLKSTLDQAAEAGEISSDTDTRAVARFLNATVHGLVVLGKASASRAALKDVVRVALTAIK